MKDINAQLSAMLKSLHLPGMRKSFDDISIRAQKEGLSHSEFLLELLERELGVPITLISIGPDRSQTIFRE